MNNKLLVSTYNQHFPFVKKLAQSFERRASNAKLCIVTTNIEEQRQLENIIGTNHEILNLFDLCENAHQIRKGLNPYQAIKKSVILEKVDYDRALLMDSDGYLHKDVDFNIMFDNYFNYPKVFYSNLKSPSDDNLKHINYQSIRLIDPNLQNFPYRVFNWCFEYQGWFVEKSIFLKMLEEIKIQYNNNNYIDVMNQYDVFFEIISYFWFIEKYKNVQYVNIENQLQLHLQEKYNNFIEKFYPKTHGILETLLKNLDSNNYSSIKNFINNNNIEIVRIQNDYNVELCMRLLSETCIKMTACSELFYDLYKE